MREANAAFENVTLYLHDIMMNRNATPWYSRVASSVLFTPWWSRLTIKVADYGSLRQMRFLSNEIDQCMFVDLPLSCHLEHQGRIIIQSLHLSRHQDVALGGCPQTPLLPCGRGRQVCATTGVLGAIACISEASEWRRVSSASARESALNCPSIGL